jgi:hypothetical protein
MLAYLAIRQKSWTIDQGDRVIEHDSPVPATTLASETHVSLRSVRRILAQARQAGFLAVGPAGRQRPRPPNGVPVRHPASPAMAFAVGGHGTIIERA